MENKKVFIKSQKNKGKIIQIGFKSGFYATLPAAYLAKNMTLVDQKTQRKIQAKKFTGR